MSDEKTLISGEIDHTPKRGRVSVEHSKKESGSVD